MSRKAPRSNHQILEEASTWFVAFRGEVLTENSRQEFQDWLKRSPEHIRAYLEIASVYADVPAPVEGRTPPELIAKAKSSPDSNLVAWLPGGIATQSLQEPPRRSSRNGLRRSERPFVLRVIAVAMTLAIVALGAWIYVQRNVYATGIGEQRSINLPDGSILELNARSKVRVAFHDRQRDVDLLEGQALFRVAKDHNRPFVVHVGATGIRAVGTQFDVYRRRTDTTVTVLEGRVAVLSGRTGPVPATEATPESAAPEPPSTAASVPVTQGEGEILLAAGEQAIVTPTHAEKADRPNIPAVTAWTQHQLVFDATPLSDVVEEFSRYSSRRLVIDSADLAGFKISGQYTSASPDSLLHFLSLQKGVVLAEVDGEIHIRRK
jgi:transmembrane sensor